MNQPMPPQQQAAIQEANRRIQAVLEEFDLQIVFQQQYLNGEQVHAGFVLVPNPPRIAVAGAVREAIQGMSS